MSISQLYHQFLAFMSDTVIRYVFKNYINGQLKRAKSQYKHWEALSKEQKKEIAAFWGIKHPIRSDFATHEVMMNVRGQFDVRYCPESVFRLYLDDDQFYRPWTDKNYYERFQPGLPVPYTYVRNVGGCFLDHDFQPIDKEAAKQIILSHLPLIVKPSILSGEGKNIKLITNEEETDKIFLEYDKDYLLQEFIEQCDVFQKVCPHSVASMRIITAMVNGKPVVLKKQLLCNVTDSIAVNSGTDRGAGVVIIPMDNEGKFEPTIYYENTRKSQSLPSGVAFEGLQIPSFDEALKIALEAHKSMPMLDFIGWDITIDKNNRPVVIEWNQRNLEIYHSQLTQGPLFGEYTDYFVNKAKKAMERKIK